VSDLVPVETVPPEPSIKRNLSLTSFIIALVAPIIPGPGFLYSATAAIIGHIAFAKEPQARGWSLAGIILGWLGVLFSLLLLFIIVPILGLSWEFFMNLLKELNEWVQQNPESLRM